MQTLLQFRATGYAAAGRSFPVWYSLPMPQFFTKAWLMLAIGSASVSGQCAPGWSAYGPPYLDAPTWTVTPWEPDGAAGLEPVLVAGGNFQDAGSTILNFVGAWDGSAWRELPSGTNGTVEAVWANPTSLVIGGVFTTASGYTVNNIATWWNGAWADLDMGAGGSGPRSVWALGEYQGSLYAAGPFSQMGGVPAQGIARWDGADWHVLADPRASWARCLVAIDSGLYAGGYFVAPLPTFSTTGILRFDGQSWQLIGSNYPRDYVYAIARFQGRIYAGGSFDFWGNPGNPSEFIASLDGNTWSPVGGGLNGRVYALQVFDPDGPGAMPEFLIAAGSFTMAGGAPASRIAAWDGVSWSTLGGGVNGTVHDLTIWRNRLAAAGVFTHADGIPSPGVAFWGCPQPEPCYPNCDGSSNAPSLNVTDFTCFLQRFAVGCSGPWPCYANCDGSTILPYLNVADFTCFLQRFAAGCP
jgi:hypothetical protein